MSFTEPTGQAGAAAPSRGHSRIRSAWKSLAVIAAVGGMAGWLAACSSRVPLSPSAQTPPPGGVDTSVPRRPAGPPPLELSGPARDWDEYRTRAALLIVAANPTTTYMGEVPEPLLAIPVIEVELRADGSISKLQVLRYPSQAKDTTQLAIDAIRRSAPFGDVSRLPKPWKFAEVFLFDEDRKFKPRTLDK